MTAPGCPAAALGPGGDAPESSSLCLKTGDCGSQQQACTTAAAGSSLSPQEWLRAMPRGAYTTLLVRGPRQELLDWPVHLERLLRSLRAMHEALGLYGRYYRWLQTTGASEAAALHQLLVAPVQAALLAARQAQAAARDLMLVVVLPPDAEAACGLSVRVHAHTLAGPPDTSPGTAVVLGGPRTVPVGKDSGWVAERRPLEALRPPGTADVLLCAGDGRLLEGLVTNLFVVAAAAPGGAGPPSTARAGGLGGGSSNGERAQASGSGGSAEPSAAAASGFDPAGLVVLTAGMGDGVVWGTSRARVLQACLRLGLAVREEAPDPRLRATWREAFLTNSLRLVQPLACIACGAANVWGLPPWELHLPQAPGPATAAVRAALQALQPSVCAAELGAFKPSPGLSDHAPAV